MLKTLQKFNLDKYIWFYCPNTTCKHFWQGDKFFTTADVLNDSILLYRTNCNMLLAKCHKKKSWKAVWWNELCNAASEQIEMSHSQHFTLDFHTYSMSSSYHFLPWKETFFYKICGFETFFLSKDFSLHGMFYKLYSHCEHFIKSLDDILQ